MKIPAKAWVNYVNGLNRINKAATDKVGEYLNSHPLHGTEDMRGLIDYAYSISTKYGEAAAALACEMYDAIGAGSGEILQPAEPAPTPRYGEVAKTVQGTAKYNNPKLVSNAVGRLVKRTAADTTLNNAERDGAQFAWIPHGDTCSFCIALASRGWQYMSKDARKNGHAEHIHANCDCEYAIRFDKKTNYEGYDPDKYLNMYESAEGKSSQDKINSMRRMKYQENKDRINAQKREAYAERRGIILAAQTEGDASIPKSMIGNFVDFEPLLLSEEEKTVISGLHKKSLEKRYEYGKIIYDEGETDYITSELYDKVALPIEQTEGTHLKVFHSHTNDTPPSSADFKPLTLEKVDRIGVITNNGDVWIVEVGDGYIPDIDELMQRLGDIKEELSLEIQEWPEFSDWTPEERNYMLVREKMYRAAREYGWKIMGGRLDEW